jgi:hypothetical protein
MSIAVSVMVKPSRLLLMTVGAMCLLVAAIGVIIASGHVGGLHAIARPSISICSFFLAVFGFYHTARNQLTLHIDISGTGQIRVARGGGSTSSCREQNWPHVTNGEVVRMMKDSTIWPKLLLLRLQAEDGKITVVPVLPDCVSRDSFRALSVACRWIAAHNNPTDSKNL